MRRKGGDLEIYESWAMYDEHCPRRSCWERTVTRMHTTGTPHRLFVGCLNSILETCPRRGQTDFVVAANNYELHFRNLSPDWYRERHKIELLCNILLAEGVPPRLVESSVKKMINAIRPPIEWQWDGSHIEVRGKFGTVRLPSRPWVRKASNKPTS